jgi:O-antigen/teichoic acid export membrane protein
MERTHVPGLVLRHAICGRQTVTITRQLGKGFVWNSAASVATQGATLLTNILAANLLGITTFGEFSYVQVTLLSAIGIAQGAVATTTTRYTAELRAKDKQLAGDALARCSALALGLAAATALLVGIIATWLSAGPGGDLSLGGGLAIGIGFVFFSVLTGLQSGALGGLQSYKTLALNAFVAAGVQIVLCLALVIAYGLYGLLAGLLLSSGVRYWLFRRALGRSLAGEGIAVSKVSLHGKPNLVFAFAIPSLAIGLTSNAAQWWALTFLARAGGYEQLAIFNAANNLRSLILFLPLAMHSVALSVLNHQLGMGDYRLRARTYWLNIGLTSLFTVIIALPVTLFASEILSLYGASFRTGEEVLRVLMAAAVLEVLCYSMYQAILTDKRMWFSLFVINIPWALALSISAYAFTPDQGARGTAIAYCIAYAFALVPIAIHLASGRQQKHVRVSDA